MTLEICHAKFPTQTADLIASLKRNDLGKREAAALNEIKTQMVQEFTDNSKSLFYWQEACMLCEIVTEPEFEELVFAFSTAITDGVADNKPVNHDLLRCFARCLRQSKHKIPCQRARFGSVLAGLNSHLTATIQVNDLQTIYFLLCTIGNVLDAMVDIKFSDLDREVLHSPLKKTLAGLAENKDPRIVQVAEYASQALSRVPDNEGPWEEFFRVSGDAIQAAAKISGGAAKLDPSQILDAGPDLLKILKFFASAAKGGKDIWDTREDLKQIVKAMQDVSERKGWYDALRQTDILIRSKAYTGLRKVLPILKCLKKAPFWSGLYAQLERQWMLVGKGERTELEQIIHWILHEEDFQDYWTRHESVQCWIVLIADSLHRPEWKDVSSKQKRKHRLLFLTRKKEFDPQLKAIPHDSHGEQQSSPHRLLHKAISSCKVARLLYADAILVQYYTNGGLLNIKRLSGDDVPMNRCYVNLCLVEQQSGKNKEQNSLVSLQKRLEAEAPKQGKEISLHDLFKRRRLQNKQVGRPGRILIRGRAGVGKTTLCKRLVYEVLNSQLWASEYDRVIWIPLRRLKDHASLESFLEKEVFRKTKNGSDMLEILRETFNSTEDDRSLFILDGLDEIIGYQRPGGSLVECIWDLLNRKHVIITSRPHAAFPANLDPYDLEIETVGFHDREIASYVDTVISNPSQRIEIMNFINRHWQMKGLMRIPIQLDALCFTWSEDLSHEKSITTMTGLYSQIEMELHRKDMVRMGKIVNGQPLNEHTAARLTTHRQIYKVMKSPIDVVRFMAFFGMYHGLTEFTSEMRANIHDAAGDTTDIDLDHISFLRSSDVSLAHQNQLYYFLHLTFQEYFAAQHFVHSWKNGLKIPTLDQKSGKLLEIDPANLLAREKYNGRYNIMWRFVAGILEIEDKGEERHVLKFLKHTEEKPLDLLGRIHLCFLMSCFSEIRKTECSHELIEMWKNTSSQLVRLLLFDLGNERLFGELGTEMEFPEEILLSVLEEGSVKHKADVVFLISMRRFLSPRICNALVQAFKESDDVGFRENVAMAIRFCHGFPSELVIDMLQGSEPQITQELLRGLGSQKHLPSVTVEKICLSAASKDEGFLNRRASFLGCQHRLPERILQEMIPGLTANSAADRSRAIRSLGTFSLSHIDVLDLVVGEFNEKLGTDTEGRLELLRIHPTLSPRIIQEITERLEEMTEREIELVMRILYDNQPLEVRIVNRIWILLDCEGASREARRLTCDILRDNDALFEEECLSRFLTCQRKDEFAQAVTWHSLNHGLCPPEPILNHCISLLSESANDIEAEIISGSEIYSNFNSCLFMRDPLPRRVVKALWLLYDKAPSYISRVLGLQAPLPDKIISDLVPSFRADAARGFDTKHYMITLRGCAMPDDLLEYAFDALFAQTHEHDLPEYLLDFLIEQEILPPRIFNALATLLFCNKYFQTKIERLCEKHGGLVMFLTKSDSHIWESVFKFLFERGVNAGYRCFLDHNCLHIQINRASMQISIESHVQRQKLQSAIDHIHELTHGLIGSSEEERRILSLVDNLTFEPASSGLEGQ